MDSPKDNASHDPASATWQETVEVEATLDPNVYRATYLWVPEGLTVRRAYGGLIVSQALMAATKSINEQGFLIHSVHCYFLNPVLPTSAVLYRVDESKNGRNFCARSVTALQNDRAVFHCLVSFYNLQSEEMDFSHSWHPMPNVSSPESEGDYIWKKCNPVRGLHLETYPCIPRVPLATPSKPMEARSMIWMRHDSGPVQHDSENLHRIALAYASDWIDKHPIVKIFPDVWTRRNVSASLDHSIWFHAPVRADKWHLFVQDCDRVAGQNGLTIGRVFNTDGIQVATFLQDFLIRAKL